MDKDMKSNQAMTGSDSTLVSVYDNYDDAKAAIEALTSAGFSRSSIQLDPESEASLSAYDSSVSADRSDSDSDTGLGGFFRRLFGMDDEEQHHDIYSESVRRGHCVLTVDVKNETEADRASDILNQFNPIDIDKRVESWRSQGWTGYDASAPRYTEDEIASERSAYASSRASNLTEEKRIPVVEENIEIGKRQVQRGGVRVFTRVKETPVNESVSLREEHVKVERRPVSQSSTKADMDAFKEDSIELRENAEEAVVGKSARVVEEVVVGKETTERTQDIHDTVRKTDVEVEQLGASDHEADFRSHWQTNFGSQGGRYEDFAPAYSYGSSMASSERYKNAQWEDVEPQWRSEWESTHPGSKWEKVKDAVRYGSQRGISGRR